MAFCTECGNQVNDKAVVCTQCGVAIEKSADGNNQMSKWALTLPILGIVLGAIGLMTFLDDSVWDMDMIIGGLILFALPPIVLGAVALAKKIHTVMGIISIIIGCVVLFGLLDELTYL
ncbi:zinc-ribbon domain-containing protein [Dehalococcoidia bacterium]|nr:zinc-ribbon domain-containing protein [Dehalococcoidia bacterium]